MYTMVYIRQIAWTLWQTCTASSLREAAEWLDIYEQRLSDIYANMNDAEILDHSWELYERLREMHAKQIDRLGEDAYCVIKWVVYHMQHALREKHLDIFDYTQIINDFDWFDTSTIHGRATKRDYLDMMIERYEPYKTLLGKDLSFTDENPGFRDDLSKKEKELLDRSKALMWLIVYKQLYDLVSAWVFDRNDVELLKDVVSFEFIEWCGLVNWRYEIKETLTSQWVHVSYEIQGVHFKVNLCGNFFVLRWLPDTYEKIITHELGHHFYYYHDRLWHEDYLDICWISAETTNGSCDANDFVSDYAQTLAVEDYAEQFMYTFLDLDGHDASSILDQKTTYFENQR